VLQMSHGDGADERSGQRDLADALAAEDAPSAEAAALQMCTSLQIPSSLLQIKLTDRNRRLLCAPVQLFVRQRKKNHKDLREFWLFSDVLIVGVNALATAADMQVLHVMPLEEILLQQTLWDASYPFFDLLTHRGKLTAADRLESLRCWLPDDDFPEKFSANWRQGSLQQSSRRAASRRRSARTSSAPSSRRSPTARSASSAARP